MKINSPATQPNFTARVKNNDFMQNYIKNSSKNNLKSLKTSLNALDKVHQGDVLEIRKNKKGGFDVDNLTKKTSNSFTPERTITPMMDFPIKDTLPLSLPKLIKDIATKGTEAYNKVFNAKEKTAKQNDDERLQKEISDVVAWSTLVV